MNAYVLSTKTGYKVISPINILFIWTSMLKILKENLLLLFGALLPILLIIFFTLAYVIPKHFVKSPQYDFLYLASAYSLDDVITQVTNGKLRIWIAPTIKNQTLPLPKLLRFKANIQSSIEVPIKLLPRASASGISTTEKEEFDLSELQDLRIDTKNIAPDGYKIEFSSLNEGGALNIIATNPYQSGFRIAKNGNIIKISNERNNQHKLQSIKIIGWILPQQDKK